MVTVNIILKIFIGLNEIMLCLLSRFTNVVFQKFSNSVTAYYIDFRYNGERIYFTVRSILRVLSLRKFIFIAPKLEMRSKERGKSEQHFFNRCEIIVHSSYFSFSIFSLHSNEYLGIHSDFFVVVVVVEYRCMW